MILALLAAHSRAAQEDIVAYENAVVSYSVENHPGNSYQWEVFTQLNPDIQAGVSDIDFNSVTNLNAVQVHWLKSGLYYLKVTETDLSGCVNVKAIAVSVLTNDRFIGFKETESIVCLNNEEDSYELDLEILDNNGLALAETNFPISLTYSINGDNQNQSISYNKQSLQLDEAWLKSNTHGDHGVEVTINSALDNFDRAINIHPQKHTHERNVYSIPSLAFVRAANKVERGHRYYNEVELLVGNAENAEYTWQLTPGNASTDDLSMLKENKVAFTWDGPVGDYTLSVFAIDGHGCLSETINQFISIVEPEEEEEEMRLFAISDYFVGQNNASITGDVSTNDFYFPANGETWNYTLTSSAQGLTFRSDGSFMYSPQQGFTGDIQFSYKACSPEDDAICVTADVVIHVMDEDMSTVSGPMATQDVILAYSGQVTSGNLLSNDLSFTGNSLVLNLSPEIAPSHGTLNLLPNGTFQYTSNPEYVGVDKFKYIVCDSQTSACESAWVYIYIDKFESEEYLPPPSVDNDLVLYEENSSYSLKQNDFSLTNQSLNYRTSPVVNTQFGTVDINSNGTFSYIPDDDFSGIDWFVYEVCANGNTSVCRQSIAYIFVEEQEEQELHVGLGKDIHVSSCQPYMLEANVNSETTLTYLWAPAENLSDPTIATPVFNPVETTTFVLKVNDENGTSASDTFTVHVSDLLADAGNDINMSVNNTAILDAGNSIGTDLMYFWTSSSGVIESGENTPTPVVRGFGKYYLEVIDKYGCVSKDSVEVKLFSLAPVAEDDYDTTSFRRPIRIDVLSNDTDPENDIVPLSLTITQVPFNGSVYVDYNNIGIQYTPDYQFTGNDFFEYQICDVANNCDRANVYVMVTDYHFVIPEAFSPNGDNINDYFEIIGIENFEGNSLQIFNRWGNMVYEATNYGISTTPKFWDGKSNTGFLLRNEELPTGTYYYVLKLGNGENPIAGSIYLDR